MFAALNIPIVSRRTDSVIRATRRILLFANHEFDDFPVGKAYGWEFVNTKRKFLLKLAVSRFAVVSYSDRIGLSKAGATTEVKLRWRSVRKRYGKQRLGSETLDRKNTHSKEVINKIISLVTSLKAWVKRRNKRAMLLLKRLSFTRGLQQWCKKM